MISFMKRKVLFVLSHGEISTAMAFLSLPLVRSFSIMTSAKTEAIMKKH
jgi:hypothetical protein